MNRRNRLLGFARQALNASTVAALCIVMVAPPALAAEGFAPADPAPGRSVTALPAEKPVGPLTQQQRILHALNRLTFGPRPGDEAAVSKMGLEAWFERQLHPETIDDSAFDERMKEFPAMDLSQAELMRRFPSPQMIRQIQTRGGAMPHDAVEKAIYADASFTYEAQRRKQEKSTDAATAQVAAGDPADDNVMQQPGMETAAKPTDAAPAVARGKKGKLEKHSIPVADMSDEDVQAVLDLPPDQRFDKIVAMPAPQAVAFRDALHGGEKYSFMRGFTPQQIETVTAMQSPVRVVGAEAMETRLLRDVYSDRQLQAVMTDFWLNHFSVYAKKNQNEPYMLPDYERKVILPHALGKFENLLVATAASPAMLLYLDNWESIGPDSPAAQRITQYQGFNPNGQIAQKLPKGINENYGRELMELHTLGVNGGYTQKDVIEVARCFTGWTINRPYGGGGGGFRRGGINPADTIDQGAFVFDASRHETGDKVVLGHTIKDGGINEGLQVLHLLATNPNTAHFISKKLAQRFVADDPPPALVDRMAATFLKTGGDIKSVLSTMFHSPEFWSPAVYRAKVKTPIEFMASALRASDANVNNAIPLVQAMERLGMPIYGMQTPNGYSWQAEDWVSSNALISRMNFALVLSGGRMPGTRTNWPSLLGDTSSSVTSAPTPATEKDLEALLLGQSAAEHTRQTVLSQFNNPTAQHMAETNFNARPVQEGDQSMDQAGGSMRYAALVRAKGSRKNNNGNGDFDQLANLPETPLDTMAGLLLGSPDFQRR